MLHLRVLECRFRSANVRCAGDGFSAFGLSSLLAGSTSNHVRWLG